MRMKRYHDFIKRTISDNEYREECARNADYYKLWNSHTSKHTNWTGPQYYEIRAQKEKEAQDRERKRLNLTLRRQRLSEKLRTEALEHSNELRRLKHNGTPSTDELRYKYHEIQDKLDTDRKSEADLQLYHLWRRDEPAIRQAETEFRRGVIQQTWAHQIESRRIAEEAMQAEAARIQHEQNLINLREAEEAMQAEQKKREEECRLAQLNAEQAQDRMRANSKAAEELRLEEASASRLEHELFQLEKERALKEQQRNQSTYRFGLQHQAAFRLRQRAVQVQQELEEDRALLKRVHEAMEREASNKAEQLRSRKELAATLKNMAEQARREAALSKLNANIFQEEAMLELKVQEERWQKEKAGRKKLLACVLAEQQAQAKVTREKAARQRNLLQDESEELRRITEHHLELQKAQAKFKVQQQLEYQEQLDKQVTEKDALKRAEREKQRLEEIEHRRKAAEDAAKLDQELKKIMLGRQRVAWL